MVQLVKSFGIRAYACHPLMSGDLLLGTLSFASRSRDEFDADELEFLRTICDYVTVAYERVRLIQQLRDSDRRKDEFLAVLAHELRNPLAPIRNSLQLLRMGNGNGEIIEQARSVMERQLEHMVHLIDDLLDVSRITRGKIQLRKERVELAAAVQSALEAARPLIEASNHELTVRLPPEPTYLDADPTRLAQVFSNLLTNAAKYTERAGRIWLTVERQSGDAVVSVRDTGIGIAAEYLPRVFQMFSQVAPALERSQGGLGIGLSLVKGLVEMHGGTVEAHSDGPGKGSQFVVRLPVVDLLTHRSIDPERDAAASARCSPSRILVVDDNRDSVDSLATVLQLQGHDIQTARDGVEAVQAAAAFRPNLVLLDIGLPKMNGYEAAQRIRQHDWGKTMVLIAMTGWGQDEDKRRALQAGFDHHMTKPVDPVALEKLMAVLTLQNGA
jgi:signal transduction histidine kinase/ActR/RegA family two-component response regulator